MPLGKVGKRRAARAELRNLEALEGDPRYLGLLEEGLNRARNFAAQFSWDRGRLRSARVCDTFLLSFVKHCFGQGFVRNQAILSLLAVQREFGVRGRVPRCWAAMSDWRNL